jgi:hypothetical protein
MSLFVDGVTFPLSAAGVTLPLSAAGMTLPHSAAGGVTFPLSVLV